MTDVETVDLMDTRGRVVRLAIAAGLGLVVAMLVFGGIRAVAVPPNGDPISKLGGLELALGLFLVFTAIVHAILTRLARRSRA